MSDAPAFTPFLQLVAADLQHHFSEDYSRIVVVFPNKRASLFLNDHLLTLAGDAPIWAPQYQTINQLFHSLSDRQLCDPIEVACRLYRHFAQSPATLAYVQESQTAAAAEAGIAPFVVPTLDEFFGWAERILADFGDVDKNLANASQLFANLSELREMERSDFLTEEEVHTLQRFFADFDPEHRHQLRERYQLLWNQLGTLYAALNAELDAEGLAYEGALFRRVVTQLQNQEISFPDSIDCYVFVGFNVLDRVEEALFHQLHKAGKARFYWDYDEYYASTAPDRQHFEAGLFLRHNLLQFPNALKAATYPSGRSIYDNLAHIEQVEMVSANSEVAQAQGATSWLRQALQLTQREDGTWQLPPDCDLRKTAVVLCNESMLHPLLHALPEGIGEVNITKGFPLAHTEVASWVEERLSQWEELGEKFQASDALTQLHDQLEAEALRYEARRAQQNAAERTQAAERAQTWREPFERILQSESYLLMSNITQRLLRLAQPNEAHTAPLAEVRANTLRRLFRQVLSQQSIPFEGDPVVGLQVMGLLETRCLDFEQLLLLSVNEGNVPKTSTDNSFIPYLLRRHFGLTTPERRTAVSAFYFYRLIQRSRRLRLCYNAVADGLAKGEMSRFMAQLMVESELPITHRVLTAQGNAQTSQPRPIPKPSTAEMLAAFARRSRPLDPQIAPESLSRLPRLSPSALASYLRCQQSFYYKYILGLRETPDTQEEMPNNVLGTLFHLSAERAYQHLAQNDAQLPITSEGFKLLRKDEGLLRSFIAEAFASEHEAFRPFEAEALYQMLRNLLRYESHQGNVQLLGTETEVYGKFDISLPTAEAPLSLCIGGTIDHLSLAEVSGRRSLRLVDFKTGNSIKNTAKRLSDIFDKRGRDNHGYLLQTLLYASVLHQQARFQPLLSAHPLVPQLFFVTKMGREDYTATLRLTGSSTPKDQTDPTTFEGEILDFAQLREDYEAGLKALVAEILDTQTHPYFAPCADPECKFCQL